MVGVEGFRWIAGENTLAKYVMDDGWGGWRSSVCGSPVPRMHSAGQAYWVPAGLLEDDPGVGVAGHIFVGSRAPWDNITDRYAQYEEGVDGKTLR
jgi:hypothetical protein